MKPIPFYATKSVAEAFVNLLVQRQFGITGGNSTPRVRKGMKMRIVFRTLILLLNIGSLIFIFRSGEALGGLTGGFIAIGLLAGLLSVFSVKWPFWLEKVNRR